MTSFLCFFKSKLFILSKFPFDTVKFIHLGKFMLNFLIVDAHVTWNRNVTQIRHPHMQTSQNCKYNNDALTE